MARIPKGFRTDLSTNPQKIGFARRQEILDDIDRNGTYLPRAVMYEDIDKAFIKFVEEDLMITIEGERVPVIFLTIQRWSEFSRTWQHSDEYKNIKMPFITIVRQPNPQVGTNQAGLYNIPGRRNWTYMKVPTFDGIRTGIDIYKIPQPVSVDFTYEVRMFCNRMRDLNKLNYRVHDTFRSIQHYVYVNGHPMPILLESIGDESNIDDFENRRFYVQPYEMKFVAYVLDEEKFEVLPTINRALVMTEIQEELVQPKIRVKTDIPLGCIIYNFEFAVNSDKSFSFISEYDSMFTEISNVTHISNIVIKVNGSEKFNGLTLTGGIQIKAGDRVAISVSKPNNKTGVFTLTGKLT